MQDLLASYLVGHGVVSVLYGQPQQLGLYVAVSAVRQRGVAVRPLLPAAAAKAGGIRDLLQIAHGEFALGSCKETLISP